MLDRAEEAFTAGACFHSLRHETPARLDIYRAQAVDGLGCVVRERLFAVELDRAGSPVLRGPGLLGDLSPCASAPGNLPSVVTLPKPTEWLTEHALIPFAKEARAERSAEVERIREHVELALQEVLMRTDQEIGRAHEDIRIRVPGAAGRLAQAEARHAEVEARRERRRRELEQEGVVTLQGVQRLASVLILPHPERASPDVPFHQPLPETEMTAMRVVIEHEEARGCTVTDVHRENLGYDVRSLDTRSGELRLIEVKGLAASSGGSILLTPNEQRVAQDRKDCYWLYVVTNCVGDPVLEEPIRDPARLKWREVTKVQGYSLSVKTLAALSAE